MIIGSISESLELERRVSITPDIVKKYKSIGLEINLSKNYGSHLGISDQEYESEGANILSNDDDVISNSNAILQMNIPDDENLALGAMELSGSATGTKSMNIDYMFAAQDR